MDLNQLTVADVRSEVVSFVGLPLWSFVGGNGSRIALDFGERILRRHPLTNDTLTEEQRLYEAERFLFVQCPWTLTRRGNEVATWEDEYEDVDDAFAELIGLTVSAVLLDDATGRLDLTFENGDQLRVVNDQVEPGLDGYSLFSATRVLTVDADGMVRSEIRDPG